MENTSRTIEETLNLCDEVWENNKGKWWSPNYWWCWGCRKFSKSPEERCFSTEDQKNDACSQINNWEKKKAKKRNKVK